MPGLRAGFALAAVTSGEGDAGAPARPHTSKVQQQRILYIKAKILNICTTGG